MSEPWTLTREQSRAIDASAAALYHMPGVLLMENAGRGAAALLATLNPAREPVVIVCGAGNNGGDGFVVARHAQNHGMAVELWVIAPLTRRGTVQLSDDAEVNFAIAQAAEIPTTIIDVKEPGDWLPKFQEACAKAGWVVDALFGTGLTRAVTGPHAEMVHAVNASGKPVLAIDVPSGLDANTGDPLGLTVTAHCTATFVAPKAGFANPISRAFTGDIHVIDIGAPKKLLDETRQEQL